MFSTARSEAESLAAIVRGTDDAVIAKTLDGTITSWNDAAERLYGYTAEDIVGRPIDVLIPEDRRGEEKAIFERVHQGLRVDPYITRRRRKDGAVVDISLTVSPIRDDCGRIVGASAIARDLTAVLDREGQLEARFAALLEAAPDAIVVAGNDGVIQFANERTEQLFGHARADLVGRPVEILIPQASRARHPNLREGFFERPSVRPMGAGLQLWASRRDGTTFPVDISLSPLRADGTEVVMAAIRDISDRLAAETALREAKEDAERANQAKSDFLSRMSHELRTPLTAILGFTELLQIGEVSVDQRRMFVDRTHKAGEHLLMLINDVLDISRVETGTLTISIEPVALGPVVDDVLALLGPQAERRGIRIDNGIRASELVLADSNRLRQVLVNLVSNAIKYNRDDGLVTLHSSVNGGQILIAITDTGRGIAAGDLPRLFQPFERLGVPNGEVEGTGIGLALSKGLAESMGGSIAVQSKLGEGSRFEVWLPRAETDPTANPLQGIETNKDPRRTAKVLYIEDNPSNTVLVESALALRPNIHLLCADQGGLGLEIARQQQPDLILLDLHLPDMPGEDVLARLRALDGVAEVPVVVVSADATPRRIAALIEAGAFAFVTKPLVIREFLETVDEALASMGDAN